MRNGTEPAAAIMPSASMDSTLELVQRAAAIVHSVKAEAQQTVARATDIAGRATELLEASEKRIKVLQAAHSAAELNLREAQARFADLEKSAGQSIALLRGALAEAEQRAQSAEAKIEETIRSIQNAIRKELLGNGSLSQTPLAVAA